MHGLLDREPAAVFGAIGGLVAAVLGALVAFGVDLTNLQIGAILTVIAAIAPVATALGIRLKVFSPATHHREVEVALMTPPPVIGGRPMSKKPPRKPGGK